jgi:2-keto-myo-inositol isomerase
VTDADRQAVEPGERLGNAGLAAADRGDAERIGLSRARLLDRVKKNGDKVADTPKHEMTAEKLGHIIRDGNRRAGEAADRVSEGAGEVEHVISYALNHMVAPRRSFADLLQLATSLGLDQVEIRNDLDGVPMRDGTPSDHVRAEAAAAGVRILSINALQRFNDWNDARAGEATALARYAQGCGAEALVLCPVNDANYRLAEPERLDRLCTALRGLAPILEDAGITGLVEPLGFAMSSLRFKADAIEAIEETGLGERFRIVHDTFHHYLSGEPRVFPEWTGLVHISGVDDPDLPLDRMRDEHRVLVDVDDRCGTLLQILALMEGYSGPYSFEPFAASVHAMDDIAGALEASMHWIDREIARVPA